MQTDLAIVVTARMNSERLPGKAMADVNGKPLLYWIMRRMSAIGKVIVGVTEEVADDAIAGLAIASGFPVFRWHTGDVIGTIDGAVRKYHPNAKFVLRGLGDCPFMAHELIERACDVMRKTKSDAFAWALAPNCLPVYGAREFPYSRTGWNKICSNSKEREHADMYFHENRKTFSITYHEPPKNVYFRPYRLEVDWPEDLELIRRIGEDISLLAPTAKVIEWLDSHNQVAKLNRQRVEKTGPSLFDYETYRAWAACMIGKPIIGWDNKIWEPPNEKAIPVFCKSGQCLLGYGYNRELYMRSGIFSGSAMINCDCGGGLVWHN